MPGHQTMPGIFGHPFDSFSTPMKRIQYTRYGAPAEMQLTETATPTPAPGEVLVRVRAASINPVDWKIRQGEMKMFTGSTFPKGMGCDFAGEVVRTNAPGFQPGDAVLGFMPFKESAAFGEFACVKAELTVKMPGSLSYEQAACLPMAATAALRALTDKGQLASGMRVLVNGATGGVGMFAVQIAKAKGAHVTAVVNTANIEVARQLGADRVVDYTKESALSGDQRYDIIFDTPGTFEFSQAKAFLAPKGVFLELNPKPAHLLRQLFDRRVRPIITTVRKQDLEALAQMAGRGQLKALIGQTVPLERAVAAITALEQGQKVNGKTVIVMP